MRAVILLQMKSVGHLLLSLCLLFGSALTEAAGKNDKDSGPLLTRRQWVCTLAVSFGLSSLGYHWMTGGFDDSPRELLDKALEDVPGLDGRHVRIQFLAQSHKWRDKTHEILQERWDPTNKQHKKVWTSQRNMAVVLMRAQSKGSVAVFLEGLTRTITRRDREDILSHFPSNFERLSVAKQVDHINHLAQKHPLGNLVPLVGVLQIRHGRNGTKDILEELDTMPDLARMYMIAYGAPLFLWAAGALDEVRAAESEQELSAGLEAFRGGRNSLFRSRQVQAEKNYLTFRELSTLARMHAFAASFPEGEVPQLFLVFGSGHDFSQYNDEKLTIERIRTY